MAAISYPTTGRDAYLTDPWTDPVGGSKWTWGGDAKPRWSPWNPAPLTEVSWDDVTDKPAPINALSGTNTGDQDLSGYATTSALTSGLAGKAPSSGIAPSAITGTAVVDADSRLTNARTPTAHKSSHATGGSDALTPSDIGAQPASVSKTSTAQIDTTVTSEVDITGLTGYSLDANTIYRVEFYGRITSAASGGWCVYISFDQNLDATTSQYTAGYFCAPSASAANALACYQVSANNIKINFRTEARTSAPMTSTVYFKTGSVAPTMKFRIAQNAGPSGTTSLLIGAVGIVTKL